MIDVRALLPIDLDVDEERVHDRRSVKVLEALMRHDMAPMAGRIADGEQNGLVQRARFLQGLGAPHPPMHGIIGVLQQIGACGPTQLIAGHGLQLAGGAAGVGDAGRRLRLCKWDG